MSQYEYLLTETLNDALAAAELRAAIEAPDSGIAIQLESDPQSTVINNAPTIRLIFKAELSTDELAALDDIIAAHDGASTEFVDAVQIANIPEVVPRRPIAPRRAYAFSHNWCDKTTWYTMSKRVTDKVIGTGDGSKKDFVLEANYPVIESGRGKITDDHRLRDSEGKDYCVHVKTGTTTGGFTNLTERYPFEETGGDYWVDYDNPGTEGTMIHFTTAPASGDDIVVTYNYCDTDMEGHSVWLFMPPPGKKWIIDHVEAQFTSDVGLSDTIIYQAWLNHPQAGWMPVPGEEELRYHSAHNYDDYVRGALPEVPAWGGTSARGRLSAGRVVQWDYDSSIVLLSSLGVAVRVWCKHDRAMDGTRVTITIYAMEEDE